MNQKARQTPGFFLLYPIIFTDETLIFGCSLNRTLFQ